MGSPASYWMVFACAVALLGASPTLAQDGFSIIVDQARVIRLPTPADTVIIGNPMIADATVRDARTLIVTGRTFGTTNLIVLDAAGQQIAEELVTVQTGNPQLVTLYKLGDRRTYSCTPDCEPTLAVGDTADIFQNRRDQITDHNTLAQGPGGGG